MGVGVSEGDTILAVNGRSLSRAVSPQSLLVHQAGQRVELRVANQTGKKPRTVVVKTLSDDTPARYREWVESNRARVLEQTKGRVGYLHIPNMGAVGYAEFHRSYLSQLDNEALIVDVRHNGGGNVSQIILEKLSRRRVGYDLQRWGEPEPYPSDSVLGPVVCLSDEHAGSDGDIFTHCFKLMKIGPVVGKRTWGGVVGIWPRHELADGSLTTQPEFAFWFSDVGWGVENYGTDPDHDVDIAPHEYAAGNDPQLDKAITLVMTALERQQPKLPTFDGRPNLALPTLPPRPKRS
jgi:tricorn protease